MARLEFRLKRYAESIRWSDRALALAEPLRLDETIGMALVTKGTAMASSGQLREGLALVEGAVVDATAHRQNLATLRGLNNLASTTAGIDPRASMERTKLGIATVRRLGFRSFDSYHAGNAVGAAEPLGEWTWLRETVSAMLEDENERDEREWLEFTRDYFTAWTGQPDVASVERLLANARRDNDYQSEQNLSDFLARAAFASGDAARALALSEPFLRDGAGGEILEFDFVGRYALHAGRADTALDVLELIGSGPGGVADHQIEALRAGLAALEGRRDDAVALYRSALAGFRSFGLRFSLALAIFDMAHLLGPGDPAVRSVIDEGRAILEELGAHTLLARMDDLRSRQRQSIVTTSIGSERPLSSSLRTPEAR
jgi:tetratricopeptide (TPR) repeat protein